MVAGFRVALFAAALLGVLGFLLALRIRDVKPQWGAQSESQNEPVMQ